MTNNKRARENEHRRQAEHAKRQAALAAERRERQRRVWIIVGCVVAVAAGIGVVVAALVSNRLPDAPTSPSPTATATSQGGGEPSSPSPTASDPGVELAEGWGTSPAPPDPSYADGRDWKFTLATNQGDIVITLDGAKAPQATAALIKLAGDGFYNETDCHQLSTAGPYYLQCGAAAATGADSAAFVFGPLENVPADGKYRAGDVVMVRDADDPDSMSSQFQIIWKDSTLPEDSAGGYTVVGKVTAGLSIVGGIAQAGTITGDSEGWPAVSVIINEVTIK